jgi:hypothetical protein
MKSRGLKLSLAASALALTLAPLAAHAQWWQHHPAYLKAMSDLREAYWMVEHRDTNNPIAKEEEKGASRAIRVAYQNLKDASIFDGKNIDDQPSPDVVFGDRKGRLHRAMDLLRDAHDEVNREEDDPAARGFKKHALHAIDDAARETNAAMHAWNF